MGFGAIGRLFGAGKPKSPDVPAPPLAAPGPMVVAPPPNVAADAAKGGVFGMAAAIRARKKAQAAGGMGGPAKPGGAIIGATSAVKGLIGF